MFLTTSAESIACPNRMYELHKIKKDSNIFFNVFRLNDLKLRKFSRDPAKKLENFQISLFDFINLHRLALRSEMMHS